MRPCFAAMKRGSYLVNLGARRAWWTRRRMIAALEEGRLAGAALDVFNIEPLPADHVLWSMKNVIVTPHLGGFYDEYPGTGAAGGGGKSAAFPCRRPAEYDQPREPRRCGRD